MTRLYHPHIKRNDGNPLSITVDDVNVAAHVAVGWLDKKPSTRKSTKTRAKKAEKPETVETVEEETPSTGDGEE